MSATQKAMRRHFAQTQRRLHSRQVRLDFSEALQPSLGQRNPPLHNLLAIASHFHMLGPDDEVDRSARSDRPE